MLGYRGAGTHPLVSLRSAFTTSFTPRFTCLCLEAVKGGARGVSHEARARGVGRIDRCGGACANGGFAESGVFLARDALAPFLTTLRIFL